MSRRAEFSDWPVQNKNALAIAIGAAIAGQNTAEAQDAARGLEEMIVTAEKRDENLQDTAFSIQAFSQEDLRRQASQGFEDYVKFLPSVSYVSTASGSTKIIFRGVSDSPDSFIADSSAAIYLDEQPLTHFGIAVDPRMVDIERVEALSGPQGTLFGDSSQSGTLRIITNKPDPTRFESNVDVSLRTGSDVDESYDVSGMVNIPLIEDKFAVRLVGYSAHDGGYIDNVFGTSPMRGTKDNSTAVDNDINGIDFIGGRVAAKWFVNDEWSATASAVYQKSESDGHNDYDATVGELKTVKFYEEPRDDEWWQTALTIEGSIGSVNFVSSTSYFDRDLEYEYDRTHYAAYFNYNFCPTYATYCWSGLSNGAIALDPTTGYLDFYTAGPNDQDTTSFNTLTLERTSFAQEFRLSQEASRYRWVAGVFYEKKTEEWEYLTFTPEFLDTLSYAYWTYIYSANPAGAPAWWRSFDDTTWEQWAVFGEFSYTFLEDWELTVGGRYFDQDMDRFYEVDKAFISAPGTWPDSTSPQGGDSDFVPKVSLKWNIDEERMIYGLYSEGFRAGGANRNRVPEEDTILPLVYGPDLLKNYEFGTKTRWLDNRLQVNATAFYMEWEDYQIETVDPSFRACEPPPPAVPTNAPCGQPFQVMVANAGNAEQLGLEVDIQAVFGEGWELGFNSLWVEAETSEEFVVSDASLPVPKGARLPNTPELKLSTYAQYTWQVNILGADSLYTRLSYAWQDDSLNRLEPWPEDTLTAQLVQDSYGIADFVTGLNAGSWEAQFFIKNFTDENAQLFRDTGNWARRFFGRGERISTNRPREFGVRFLYRWGD